MVVARDEDFAHLYLVLLINDEIEYNLILASHVVALVDGYFGVFVAFIAKVALGQCLGAVYHVGCYLRALHDAYLGFHVLALALLHAYVVYLADARP